MIDKGQALGIVLLTVVTCAFGAARSGVADGPQPALNRAEALPVYRVEWVYRVKWGHEDEFWSLFKQTQIPVLDKQKELGDVLGYEVYRPGLHTSEDSRWNYRIVITYKNVLASSRGASLEKQLFPDQTTYKQEESRRWELVDAHYDLPIRQIDPHTND